MSLNLINSPGKRGVKYNLENLPAQIIDTDYLSKYFILSNFGQILTAGKNSISLNGSSLLQPNSEVLIECIDSEENNLYIEIARTSTTPIKNFAYKESDSFILAIYVYNDIYNGTGKLILYGTTKDGNKVRWIRSITIDKTQKNTTKVRFYNSPKLEVTPYQIPVLSTDISTTILSINTFTGKLNGFPVVPPKGTIFSSVNRKNIDVDYRCTVTDPIIERNTSDTSDINFQMEGLNANIIINKIQDPNSINNIIPINASQSFQIKEIINNKIFKITDPFTYSDNKGNEIITNIIDASFSITYPSIGYNTATSSYLTSIIDGTPTVIKQSFADITYKNIRTFSGYVARHKIYKKSLLSNSEFQIVSDEPLFVNELLRDTVSQNKTYELLGTFYNSKHINRYWFTSSNNLSLIYTPDINVNSMLVDSPNFNTLNGNDYIIVKNDSSNTFRNSEYLPFDSFQFSQNSGSNYDSNFIKLNSGVQYVLSFNMVVLKDQNSSNSKIEFYFTSSVGAAATATSFTSNYGIKLAAITANQTGVNQQNFINQLFFYSSPNDLYGTLVIVPYNCKFYMWDLSFRVYGDDGFSPDIFTTRIEWPVVVANESFEIKSELFDINNNLVYDNLLVIQSFDPSGSTLIPFIPGNGSFIPGTKDLFVSGSLIVSKSIEVETGNIILDQGNLYLPFLGACLPDTHISQSRLLAWRGDALNNVAGGFCRTPIVDVGNNDSYLYVSTGSSFIDEIIPSNNIVFTKKSLATEYDTSGHGRKIYWIGAVKQVEY